MYHDDLGKFASKGNNQSKKEIKPYIPHYGRKPNPNYNEDPTKIRELIKDIKPEKVDSSQVPVFKNHTDLENWVRALIKDQREVKILSDGEEILISNNNIQRATRKQYLDENETTAVYFKIKNTLERAKYYDFEPKDEKHKDKRIQGQYVYFSKLIIGEEPYLIRFKIDVPMDADVPLLYAGHRIKKL